MVAAETEPENHVDLVLEGGGVKGIGLAGAYERARYAPRNIAGTSAGAINGYSAGNKFLEIWDFAAYTAAFRSGSPQSRREDITRELVERAEV